ncbi:hypothetical protein D7Y27_38600 [Corallococcus sp. AB004]|nr:hypothetical protein D7Y27_38600 [Corallococcus sp. AB004]
MVMIVHCLMGIALFRGVRLLGLLSGDCCQELFEGMLVTCSMPWSIFKAQRLMGRILLQAPNMMPGFCIP